MERMKKLKLANIFISKLEEIKNLFLSNLASFNNTKPVNAVLIIPPTFY